MPITRVALVAAAAAAAQNCSRIVRVGTFDQATPYALAPATRWLDDERACFAYYRQPSGARALELLGRGDLDLAFMGSMPWSNAVARGAGVTAVSVLMDIKSSEGLVTCLNVRRLQDLRMKTLSNGDVGGVISNYHMRRPAANPFGRSFRSIIAAADSAHEGQTYTRPTNC